MQTNILGRTGLEVSVAALGCGGHSRLGQRTGASESQSVRLVQAAIDRGVNLIDTAVSYGTEAIVGKAIAGRRHGLVLSTKVPVSAGQDGPGLPNNPALVRETVEESLGRLDTEFIDILHLHGVRPEEYAACLDRLAPVLLDLQQEGKVRFLGITERFVSDTRHEMLGQALEDGIWDVVMVGMNLLNQSARRLVLPRTRELKIGTMIMFALRRTLQDPLEVRDMVQDFVRLGAMPAGTLDRDAPLDFLLAEGGVRDLADAAYRFCRHEPGVDSVLFGTGKMGHLTTNIASLLAPPLPAAAVDRLHDAFAAIDFVSGN